MYAIDEDGSQNDIMDAIDEDSPINVIMDAIDEDIPINDIMDAIDDDGSRNVSMDSIDEDGSRNLSMDSFMEANANTNKFSFPPFLNVTLNKDVEHSMNANKVQEHSVIMNKDQEHSINVNKAKNALSNPRTLEENNSSSGDASAVLIRVYKNGRTRLKESINNAAFSIDKYIEHKNSVLEGIDQSYLEHTKLSAKSVLADL
jgi:hypothetical protein